MNMSKAKKRIYFLEGLPGSGKTIILEKLKKKGSKIIREVIDSEELSKRHNKPDQTFFFRNDEKKLKMAEKMGGTVIIDRSPLSTLLFNLAKFSVDQNFNPTRAFKWYADKFGRKFRNNSVYHFFFIDITPGLSMKRRSMRENKKDPWVNLKSLKFIRNFYLVFGENYIKNFKVINGDNDLEVILRQISSKINKKKWLN